MRTVYDALDRPTYRYAAAAVIPDAVLAGAVDTANTTPAAVAARARLLSSWTYDAPGALTLPASDTAWNASQPYRTRITSYDVRNHPKAISIDIPGATAVAGTYTYTYDYDDAGNTTTMSFPAVGGLPAEAVTTTYDTLGRPIGLGGTMSYVTGTLFDDLSRVIRRNMRTGTDTNEKTFAREYTYDGTTGRVASIKAGWDPNTGAAADEVWFQNESLAYDSIGNPTSSLDVTTGLRECYRYDSWQRLTRAWTKGAAAACETGTTAPAPTGTGGFDEAYSIDLAGRMSTWTTTELATSTTTVRSFQYNDADHPEGPTSAGPLTLGYDKNGSVSSRAGATLTWDPLHRLAGISGSQTNVYGNDGMRLVRTDLVAGTTTLFLPGQQITGPTSGGPASSAIRTYQLAGVTIATRTGTGSTGIYWNCGHRQNTTTCSTPINTGPITVAPPVAHYLPYGTPRTGSPTLPGTERGFVGQIKDATGLDYFNNRYYDPALGIFLSVDPLLGKTGDPYLYANGNPATLSDPSGLDPFDWFTNMVFGSLVHAYIEIEYMKQYPDAISDVNYRTSQGPGLEVTGFIDLASFPDEKIDGFDVISINEIRPTRPSAESELRRREADINSDNPTTVPVRGLTGALRTKRDDREFATSVSILGVGVHAWRDGAGVIVYDFDRDTPFLSPRDIFRDLRRVGEERRQLRQNNAKNSEFAVAARTATEGWSPLDFVRGGWRAMQDMWQYVRNMDLSPGRCEAPCTK